MIEIKESTFDDVKSIQALWVDPRPENSKAIALYQRLGFVKKDMPEHVIALGEDPDVFVYMELSK
jgi:hypothetical protein